MPESTRRERACRLLAGTLVVTLTTGLCGTALADDPEDRKKKIDGRITQTSKDLDGTSRELRTAQKNLTNTTKRVDAAKKALTKAEGELRKANRYNKDVGGRLKTAQAAETKIRKSLGTTTAAQARTKVLVGGIARESYMKGGLGQLQLTLNVLTADGPDVTDDLALADVVVRQQSGVLRTLAGQRSTATSQSTRLGAVRQQVAGLKKQAESGVTRATRARDGARKAKTSLEGLQRAQRTAAGALAKQKKKEEGDLKWLRGESVRLGNILRARSKARAKARADAARKKQPPPAQAAEAPRPANDGFFLTGPEPKANITSPFGYRMHPILNRPMLHGGADFSFGCGQPVYAAGPGEIVSASTNAISGNSIVIDHGDVAGRSLATQYDHLSRFAVRSGTVKKGQLIGYAGTTGRSTGCHLHFIVLADGNYVNPADYIG